MSFIKPVNCPAKKKEDCPDPKRLQWGQCWPGFCSEDNRDKVESFLVNNECKELDQ